MNENTYIGNKDKVSLLYKKELDDMIHELKKYITKNQEKELLRKKLQISTNKFNEAQYLQSACELSISYFVARKFPNTFKYESKVNPPKDIDCVFSYDGFQFNVEVKCADFTMDENKNKQPGVHIISLGRYDNLSNVQDDISVAVALNSKYQNVDILPNLDNKLKDSLVLSHEKFSSSTCDNELNVLIVCCDSALDMQRWYSYLFSNQGLFTESSFLPHCHYNNVDVVVLSNIYNRHKNYQTKSKIKNHWRFENSFNIIFQNPFCKMQKGCAIVKLASVIPNYNDELSNYRVPGDAPEYVKDGVKIPYFVSEQLTEKGIYLFQSPENV